MKPTDKKNAKPADNKMQMQELQMHRRRADVAEKQLAALRADMAELKRAVPVADVVAKDTRDALVQLLAANENVYLDKNGKFVETVGGDLKTAMLRAQAVVRPQRAVQVSPTPNVVLDAIGTGKSVQP